MMKMRKFIETQSLLRNPNRDHHNDPADDNPADEKTDDCAPAWDWNFEVGIREKYATRPWLDAFGKCAGSTDLFVRLNGGAKQVVEIIELFLRHPFREQTDNDPCRETGDDVKQHLPRQRNDQLAFFLDDKIEATRQLLKKRDAPFGETESPHPNRCQRRRPCSGNRRPPPENTEPKRHRHDGVHNPQFF